MYVYAIIVYRNLKLANFFDIIFDPLFEICKNVIKNHGHSFLLLFCIYAFVKNKQKNFTNPWS